MDPRDDDIEFDFFEDEPATTEQASAADVASGCRAAADAARGMRGPARAAARADAAPAPAGADRDRRRGARLLRAPAPVVRVDLEARPVPALHGRRSATIAHSSRGRRRRGGDRADDARHEGRRASRPSSPGSPSRSARTSPPRSDLNPPGPLRDENQRAHRGAAAARQRRPGLANDLRDDHDVEVRGRCGASSPTRRDRLLASDVVWDDFFKEPVDGGDEGARASAASSAPDSNFVANRDFITEHSMSLVLQRLRGASTGGTPTGPPRHEHRRHEGEPRRPGAVGDDREHRQGEHRPRVRRHGPRRRRLAGGRRSR